MKHNADTIVSLFISSSMSELLNDSQALAGMTPKQQTLLQTVCRTAAQDALALSGTVSTAPANRPDGDQADIPMPVICIA
ncbi:MAG: hypothetical protein K9K21_02445 [Desulfotignum sp.]|nr:hypothetical protein [Desulfotignum sp.]MCF8112693.1 hypothetical protein [Desulfotignum sp.]